MFRTHFYNERIRKSVAIFGSLFDNLYVIRKSGNNVFSQMKVPLSYAPKRKFLERIIQMTDGEERERQLAVKLPRMSFEMLAIQYDPQRQLPKVNNISIPIENSGTTRSQVFIGTPYLLTFQLNIYAKSQDDALQVVEQILPHFNPQYTVSMYPFSGVSDISEDNPIILQAVSFSDDYEGDMAQRRTIVYTLDFEMKVNFWGPEPGSAEATKKVIKQIDTNYFLIDGGINDSDTFHHGISYKVEPWTASKDSDWTIICELYDSARPMGVY